VKALLSRLLGEAARPLLEGHLRFILVDGSTVQGPGATGTQYRLHLALDLVRLEWAYSLVTDEHTGERLTPYPLQDGDVAIADRGYNAVDQWLELADRGVALVIRYNPHGLKLYPAAGKLLELEPVLQATTATDLCLPVQVRNQRREFLNGYLHARRLPAGPGGGSPAPGPGGREESQSPASSPDPGPGRVGVDRDHAPARGPPHRHGDGALPAQVASGARDQAIEIDIKY
jgi:hypothetical protein